MSNEKQTLWQKEGAWRIELDSVPNGSGQLYQRPVIRHPGAVVLIPLTAEQNVLMLRQYRYAVDQVIWEVPAGTREWGEDWLICAQRELREEAGVRAEQFELIGEMWPAPGMSDELMHLYVATGLTDDPLPADFDEQIEVVSVPLAEVVVMTHDGRIQDAKSVAAIMRTVHYLGSR